MSVNAPRLVIVDATVCRRLADLLSSRTVPWARKQSPLLWLHADLVGNFFFLLVPICHQTSPRGKPQLEGVVGGERLRGWDYLAARLESKVHADSQWLFPTYWALVSPADVSALFRDEGFGERLTDPVGRSLLIRDLGQKMLSRSWQRANDLYETAGHRIASGPVSLLELLAEFRAYDDPVRKKSYLFLALMENAGLWSYTDPHMLGAPIDYHEVRGHLRIGTIKVGDTELQTKLVESRPVSQLEDIEVRTAVQEASILICRYAGLQNGAQAHYLFWNVFRSCCTRESPHCGACPPTCALPDRYVPLARFSSAGRCCPFSDVCESAGTDLKLVEHVVDTDYY